MTYSALYLTFPNNTRLKIQVNLTDEGLQVQAIDRPDIRFIVGGLDNLQSIFSPPRRVAGPGRSEFDRVLSMTPFDVFRYFEQSSILYVHADDVRTVVLSHSEATGSDFQLSQDLEAVQGLISPSQADIAERLFGDRTKTGGAYRRRILAVINATTTGPGRATTGRKAEKAA